MVGITLFRADHQRDHVISGRATRISIQCKAGHSYHDECRVMIMAYQRVPQWPGEMNLVDPRLSHGLAGLLVYDDLEEFNENIHAARRNCEDFYALRLLLAQF